MPTYVTKEMIVDGLRSLGVKSGSIIIAHSSLKSFGYVENGADAVIDAMLDAVGPKRTVFVPTMTFGAPFHHRDTPSYTGHITEVFRQRKESIRSRHPSHSIAGIGPASARILEGHELTTPMGYESPLARIAREDGLVVLLGVGHSSNSTVHAGLEQAEAPYLTKYRSVTVRDDDGKERVVSCLHPGCSRGFSRLEPILAHRGLQRRGFIGDAVVRVVRGRDIIDVTVEAVHADPSFLLCDYEECDFCPRARGIIENIVGE